MNLIECIRVALTGLVANKMRSLLTMLGVIIGVAAIVAIVAITDGARADSLRRVQSLGSNVLTVFSGSQRRGAVSFGFGSMQSLRMGDAEAIPKACPAVARVNPEVRRTGQIKYNNQNTSCSVMGVGVDWPHVRSFKIERGRFFTQQDVRSMRLTAVIGPTTARNLFGEANPVGRRIRINGALFLIIGQTQPKGTAMFGDPDDQIAIPVTTAMKRLPRGTGSSTGSSAPMDTLSMIGIEAKTMEMIPMAKQEVETVLRRRHHLGAASDNDFIIRDQAELMQQTEEQGQLFTRLLTGIAAVSLLVGGIGIMNIMLVSVTERTREIGIRKAIGAKYVDILLQFLIESITLSSTGGLVGIGGGVLASYVMTQQWGWPWVVTWWPLALSFFFAMAVGLFFGVYPARKAALLDPIEALRYE